MHVHSKKKNQNCKIFIDGHIPANINCHNGTCDDFNFENPRLVAECNTNVTSDSNINIYFFCLFSFYIIFYIYTK